MKRSWPQLGEKVFWRGVKEDHEQPREYENGDRFMSSREPTDLTGRRNVAMFLGGHLAAMRLLPRFTG